MLKEFDIEFFVYPPKLYSLCNGFPKDAKYYAKENGDVLAIYINSEKEFTLPQGFTEISEEEYNNL